MVTKAKAAAQPAKVEIATGPDLPYIPPAPQPAPPTAGVLKQITTEADNQTHDFGLVSMTAVLAMVLGSIPWILIQSAIAQIWPEHKFDAQSIGIAIGAICGGFGVALGALGAYRNLQAKT